MAADAFYFVRVKEKRVCFEMLGEADSVHNEAPRTSGVVPGEETSGGRGE
jgi:hypothetical protein